MSNDKVLEAFRASLPDIDPIRAKLLSLRFFALCPNGKRIPVETICEEYTKDQEGLALRTFEDRLVLVLQAVFPDSEIPYWQQAFYMSTGRNSGMPGTWLPFDGILLRGSYFRPYEYTSSIFKGNIGKSFTFAEPVAPKPVNPRPRKRINSLAWFSKNTFGAPEVFDPFAATYPPVTYTLDEKKNQLLVEIYGNMYLPEGNYLKQGYHFSRFGTASYALASHALGSDVFREGYGDLLFPSVGSDAIETAIRTHLSTSSKLQNCFKEISKSYAIIKPNDVNRYIEKHYAFSYMNAFRSEGIFPPGLSFLNTPIATLGYAMPLDSYETILATQVNELWQSYKKGFKSLEEVRVVFSNPRKLFKSLEANIRKQYVLPNEPNVLFTISNAVLNRPIGRYYGGTRHRHKKAKRRLTKKA